MWCVRIVSRAFFPLDEQLALLSGNLTPFGQEGAARFAAWMPFAKAAEMMGVLCGMQVSEASVRRQAEVSGTAYVGVQEEEVTRILRELPPAAAGPAKQLLSVDGAMVPLVAGEWAEVKTLVIGVVGEAKEERGETVVRTGELSYFTRLSDAESFQRAALVETQRRGVEKAGCVIAPLDGAEWEQRFVDYHRADARGGVHRPHSGFCPCRRVYRQDRGGSMGTRRPDHPGVGGQNALRAKTARGSGGYA